MDQVWILGSLREEGAEVTIESSLQCSPTPQVGRALLRCWSVGPSFDVMWNQPLPAPAWLTTGNRPLMSTTTTQRRQGGPGRPAPHLCKAMEQQMSNPA